MLTTTTSLLVALSSVSFALQGGFHAPVMDCDETYNYLEPLHYLVHASGMQTWEYSSEFRLRSWFYLLVHSLPIHLAQLFTSSPLLHLHALRIALHLLSLAIEVHLVNAVRAKFKSETAATLTAVFLGLAPGMSHARRSLLPSSTCMMAFALAQAEWMRERNVNALLAGALSVLFAWPFSAPAFIPIGLHTLLTQGPKPVLLAAALGLCLFGAVPALVDSWYYQRPTWPLIEAVLYNAFGASGGGAHLYGVETWTYYPKNLFLNFNVLALVALGPALLPFVAADLHLYHAAPVVLTYVVFAALAHKEERFLSTIYPSLCVGAGVFLAKRVRHRLALALFVGTFSALAVSRSLALGRLAAPSAVLANAPPFPLQSRLCVGREWYRFPSSFALPPTVSLHWTASNFRGLLPQPFASRAAGQGFAQAPRHMNDMNVFEPAVLSDPRICDFYLDSDEPHESRLDAIVPMPPQWSRVACEKFCDANNSPQPFRSFALPWNVWHGVKAVDFCLWKRNLA